MSNPFDVEDGTYLVVVNAEGQHALWPIFAAAPAGWRVAHGPDRRAACLDYVTAHWTDLRPTTLTARLSAPAATAQAAGTASPAGSAATVAPAGSAAAVAPGAGAGAPPVFEDLGVDHVELYVEDLDAATRWLVDGYGFTVLATSDPQASADARSAALAAGRVRLVLTQPLTDQHPAAGYLARHGDGVAAIGLRVADAAAGFDEAVRRGARPLVTPTESGGYVTAAVSVVDDLGHTLVQRPEGADEWSLPGLRPVVGAAPDVAGFGATPPVAGSPGAAAPGGDPGLSEVDHFAVCLEPGQLDRTVEDYRRVFDFEVVFTELIVVGAQAMRSSVVRSRSGSVTLTLIEPDRSRDPGQIDEFLKYHGGPGVQHVAFATDDIVRAVGAARSRGIAFLAAPETYYRLLAGRLTPARHTVEELRALDILVDEDHDGQLFQIFARSVHPRGTLFLEVIERDGARTFGSGNIRALYEAVELQRTRETD
jgi:4-hydroxymandelate synthase